MEEPQEEILSYDKENHKNEISFINNNNKLEKSEVHFEPITEILNENVSSSRSLTPSPKYLSESGGDSGVSSEHDTPPLGTRRHISNAVKTNNKKGHEKTQNGRQSTKFHRKKNSSLKNHFNLQSLKNRLPETFQKELRAKALEMMKRRQAMSKSDFYKRDRLSYSYQKNSRISRPSGVGQDTLSNLSLVDSSCYSSTSSLYGEDDESVSSFHISLLKPLYECPDESASLDFAGIRDIFTPQQESTIKSSKGTVRGVKNRVRAGIAAFTSDQRFLKVNFHLI